MDSVDWKDVRKKSGRIDSSRGNERRPGRGFRGGMHRHQTDDASMLHRQGSLRMEWWSSQKQVVLDEQQFTDCRVFKTIQEGTLLQLSKTAVGLLEGMFLDPRTVVDLVTVDSCVEGKIIVKWPLPLAPPDNAPLIILDLNGVLVSRPSFHDRKGAGKSKTSVYRRYCYEFVRFCFTHFNVGVWSCGKRKNMEMEIFKGFEDRILFQWDQDQSTNLWPRSSIVSKEKPLFLKEITKVWEAYPFDAHNTLLIDNHVEKFENNPLECNVLVDAFTEKTGRTSVDFVLSPTGELVKALTHFSQHVDDKERPASLDSIQRLFLRHTLADLFTSSRIMKRNCPERNTEFYMKQRDIPGPRATPFRRTHIAEVQSGDWMVCEKSNGVRNMLLISPNGPCFLVDRSWNFQYLGQNPCNTGTQWSLLDGELVTTADQRGYLVFDAVWINGEDVGAQPNFNYRIQSLTAFLDDKPSIGNCFLILKNFRSLDQINDLRQAVCEYTYNHIGKVPCDGLVFTPVHKSYYEYTVIKFKPVNELSVDFRVLKGDLSRTELIPLYVVEYLRNGQNLKRVDVQVGKCAPKFDFPLPNTDSFIIECVFNPVAGYWEAIGIRADKVKPNGLSTAWSVLESIAENIDVEQLIDVLTSSPKLRAAASPFIPVASVHHNVSSVANHYNERQEKRNSHLGKKLDVNIESMRKVNNWAKAVLIHECCLNKLEWRGIVPFQDIAIPHAIVSRNFFKGRFPQQPKRKGSTTILDLACGRGGDMNKWKASLADIQYVGIDVATVALQEARERVREKNKFQFAEYDIADKALLEDIAVKGVMFDIISVQFAFHYLRDKPDRVESFFDICSQKLKTAADDFKPMILMTTTDTEVLARRGTLFENKVCRVEFDRALSKDQSQQDFGHPYSFSLGDAVKDCIEYTVPVGKVSDIAKQYGFELVLSQNMASFIAEKCDSYIPMLHSMSVIGHKAQDRAPLSIDEWEAIEFYKVLVFQRI